MVLYKRKQVTFVPPPEIPSDLSTEVYFIRETKEWFLTYDEYLARLDYYHKRKFVCEITGNSCLNFFEALESENKEIKGVEKNFPEALREHILRFLQFNRITRLDQLVDKVYSVFKNDYFPGETIYIRAGTITNIGSESDAEHTSSTKQRGTIREKVQYGQSDGVTTKYLVVRLTDMQQSIVTTDKISRDRNHFTKWLIKTFIKLTMSRSHKVGAPWVVKDKFAKKYRIPQEYPDDLKQFADSTPTGETQYEVQSKKEMVELEPGKFVAIAPKNGSSDKKGIGKKYNPAVDKLPETPFKKKFPTHYLPDRVVKEIESTPAINSSASASLQPTKKHITDDLEIKFDIQNAKPSPQASMLPENSISWNRHLVKEYKDDIKSFDEKGNDDEDKLESVGAKEEKIAEVKRLSSDKIKHVQQALQSWIFINVYHSVLNIDTFTFDDFVYAMGWNLDQFTELGRCELLDEIWCCILSAIVSNSAPTKDSSTAKDKDAIFGLQINLPSKTSLLAPVSNGKQEEEEDSEERGSDSEEDERTLKIEDDDSGNESSEETEKTSKVNNGKSDKTKKAIEEEDADNEDNDDPEEDDNAMEVDETEDSEYDQFNHFAYQVMNYRGTPWHDRLRKRNFKDGNWQCILLGVLSLVDYVPNYKPIIDKVFKKLAPKTMPATPATVLNQFYEEMDIDLKFQTLNILVDLLISGSVVRTYIDECLESSTVFRRNRLDSIKEYKSTLDAAQKANTSVCEIFAKHSESKKDADKDDSASKRPRLNYSKSMEMTEEEQKLSEKNSEFKELWNVRKEALLKLDQIKKDKREIEKKLTELDCQRVKLLGKDRLYNRYWWFENNGLPTLHGVSNDDDENEDEDKEKERDKNDEEVDDDNNEVLEETYLMGKLWVQGPSNEDLRIHFKSSFELANEFNVEYETAEFELHEENERLKELKKDDDESGQEDKKNQIREMDFNVIPKPFVHAASKLYDLEFTSKEILNSKSKAVIIDRQGALKTTELINSLTSFQRKAIEEYPHPLVNGSNWRYYDHPDQISKLLTWLNPWGKRESQLRKELLTVKDAVVSSMEARRKALSMDNASEAEAAIESDIAKLQERIDKLNSSETESNSEDNDDDIIAGSKRSLRKRVQPRKRQAVSTLEEALEYGDLVDVEKMQNELKEKLQEKREERDLARVLEWVNSKALEKFDKSLYDGGDKVKGKTSKRGRR
ncbi:imitation switch Two complex 1 [Scheffersomyces stipitis CBS 6054]|uniref:Imitation switch Two complex 1 n=1 Tax=Scheffersomyces stipitis (strain ATCC 58785 / CBS 6054 / NBRC 10063 / NRRL Y-11545) TaxID=322104 RepID=A3LT87_PICST|nr:imitation switch Two complex 1 [Scheffersomyces stipitis CBS 6054]ABN66362.2 imitation switch Two complex 1 [Scheffersomyces stipitis CBS 6054]